jgi:hypothetical protein
MRCREGSHHPEAVIGYKVLTVEDGVQGQEAKSLGNHAHQNPGGTLHAGTPPNDFLC